MAYSYREPFPLNIPQELQTARHFYSVGSVLDFFGWNDVHHFEILAPSSPKGPQQRAQVYPKHPEQEKCAERDKSGFSAHRDKAPPSLKCVGQFLDVLCQIEDADKRPDERYGGK